MKKNIYLIKLAFLFAILLYSSHGRCDNVSSSTGMKGLSENAKSEIEAIKKLDSVVLNGNVDGKLFLEILEDFSLCMQNSHSGESQDMSREIGLQSQFLIKATNLWSAQPKLQNDVISKGLFVQCNLLIAYLNEVRIPNYTPHKTYLNAPLPSGVYGISGTDYHTATNASQRALWKDSIDLNNRNNSENMLQASIQNYLPQIQNIAKGIQKVINANNINK